MEVKVAVKEGHQKVVQKVWHSLELKVFGPILRPPLLLLQVKGSEAIV